MKKYLIPIIISAALLCSCSAPKKASNDMEIFSPSTAASSAATSSTTTIPVAAEEDFVVTEDLVDLTGMSSTMVFAELYNISYYPDAYEGKKFRMCGQFTSVYIEEEDTRYYACYVLDDTGCCMQGFEFVSPDLTFPDDYPEEGEYFTVTGTIENYEKDGVLYRHLINATIELDN